LASVHSPRRFFQSWAPHLQRALASAGSAVGIVGPFSTRRYRAESLILYKLLFEIAMRQYAALAAGYVVGRGLDGVGHGVELLGCAILRFTSDAVEVLTLRD
tara:strand:+ start:26236 stop:26541 length:306 start_codon:yes stop_codon:yes gene_type:complete